MASVKFVAVSRSLKGILDYVTNREKTTDRLITGVNCVAETALDEFEAVKKLYGKTDGRSYYHIVQSFSPDDPMDFDTAHQIGLQFAAYFGSYQCLVVTHMNTAHIHNHIVMNSVDFETGKKFHQSAREMQQAKEFSNQLCLQYGLSITEAKADRDRLPKWKLKLRDKIKWAMKLTYTKSEFIQQMEDWGYQVKWEPGQKYITYTTPENIRCRDRKLFDDTLLRENMGSYYAMGGREYLENRQYDEPRATIDDVVCGLGSVLQALQFGDNDRFHLETIHHSDEEVERLLAIGRKIQSGVVYAVDDDEDEEYEQYHGFGMAMM